MGQVVPHHVGGRPGVRGFCKKPSDYRAVPMCWWHHSVLHTVGEKHFWFELGVDIEKIIDSLFSAHTITRIAPGP